MLNNFGAQPCDNINVLCTTSIDLAGTMVTTQTNATADEEEPMFMQYFRGKGGNARNADAATGASAPPAPPQFRTVRRPVFYCHVLFDFSVCKDSSLGASPTCNGCLRRMLKSQSQWTRSKSN